MPKVTPPSPVVLGNLLKGRVLIAPPKPAPVDTVVVTPPRGPVQNGPIVNPSTPPVGLSHAELVPWVRARLVEQEHLRAGSYWDTGTLLGLLMPAKAELDVKNLKELATKYALPYSHFTALKYMTVARTFDRETAKTTGVEKCYALTLYAKVIGRAGQAAQVLSRNERIVGAEPATLARAVSASQLMRIVRSKKAEAKGEKVPTAVQQERDKIGKDTKKIIRSLGFKNASASIVRRDGRPMVAIYLPLEAAQKWDPKKAIPLIAKAVKSDAATLQLLKAQVPALLLRRSA